MTMWTTPAGVAALNHHGRDTLIPHLGTEFIDNNAGKLACESRLTMALIANSPTQAGPGT